MNGGGDGVTKQTSRLQAGTVDQQIIERVRKNYFRMRIASFAALATRNLTTVFAGI
jgi:ribosomal protein S25